MAGRIAGITVEINGSTTGLTKASSQLIKQEAKFLIRRQDDTKTGSKRTQNIRVL